MAERIPTFGDETHINVHLLHNIHKAPQSRSDIQKSNEFLKRHKDAKSLRFDLPRDLRLKFHDIDGIEDSVDLFREFKGQRLTDILRDAPL